MGPCERALPLALPAGGALRPQTPRKKRWRRVKARCHAYADRAIAVAYRSISFIPRHLVHRRGHVRLGLSLRRHHLPEGAWGNRLGSPSRGCGDEVPRLEPGRGDEVPRLEPGARGRNAPPGTGGAGTKCPAWNQGAGTKCPAKITLDNRALTMYYDVTVYANGYVKGQRYETTKTRAKIALPPDPHSHCVPDLMRRL